MQQIGRAAERATSHAISRTTLPNSPARLPASGPPAPDRLCDIELPRLICWKPDVGPYEIIRALSDDERGKLEARAADLEHALRPFGDDQDKEVRLVISGMFTGFRYMRQQGESVSAAVGITLAVLREFPRWAISRGCMKIIRGEAGLDARFAPNDSEIHGVVADIMRRYRRDLEAARGLLSAKVAEREPKCSGPAQPKPHAPTLPWRGDGKHAQRIAADLAARKARNDGGEATP